MYVSISVGGVNIEAIKSHVLPAGVRDIDAYLRTGYVNKRQA
jgi:hypothetical protein